MKDYFSIGKVAGSFGLTGEVVLEHALGKKTDLKGLETIFIEEQNESFLPYFIESARLKNDTSVFLKLEGINSKEGARRILRRSVWLLKEDFDKFAGKSSAISMLGFTIINEGKALGDITEIIEQPMQILCKIMIGNNEALIPVHEANLLKIDKKKKQVHVELPEGLLELYTSG